MKLFRSVRFNVFLVLLLAAAATLGTFLPQVTESPERVEDILRRYPAWGEALRRAGLFDAYHAWWFLGLLGLMAFDVVACKLGKAPPDPGLVSLPPELERDRADGSLDALIRTIPLKPLHAGFEAGLEAAAAGERVLSALARRRYRLDRRLSGAGGRTAFVATRHRLQRWGSYCAHVALVVLLLGGLIKQLFGFEEMVPVLEGGSREIRKRPGWLLHVDDFAVEYYEGTGTPKLFASELRVTREGELLGSKRVTVNDPLEVPGGVRFYQATWGAGGMFRTVTLELGGKELRLDQRVPTPIPGLPIRVTADALLPDFTVAADGRADTKSLNLDNPAVKFDFDLGRGLTRSLWLLLRRPEAAFTERPDGVLQRVPSPPFRLAAVDPKLFSGIQVGYDPGFPVILAGSAGWLIGNILLFYLHRRRFWILVEPAGEVAGGSRVLVGAWSSRGPVGFKAEFEEWTGSLREALSEVRT